MKDNITNSKRQEILKMTWTQKKFPHYIIYSPSTKFFKESFMDNQDNWKHRSDNMKCKTCMYFVPKKTKEPAYDIGRCRRHSPTMSGWPVMFVNDWCGDHKLDENGFGENPTSISRDIPIRKIKAAVRKVKNDYED